MKFVRACNDILTTKLPSFACNSILMYLYDIHVIFWEIHKYNRPYEWKH